MKERNLAYWKGRKVQLREAIVDIFKAYCYADQKEKEAEKVLLKREA
jgi:hypothetical protein